MPPCCGGAQSISNGSCDQHNSSCKDSPFQLAGCRDGPSGRPTSGVKVVQPLADPPCIADVSAVVACLLPVGSIAGPSLGRDDGVPPGPSSTSSSTRSSGCLAGPSLGRDDGVPPGPSSTTSSTPSSGRLAGPSLGRDDGAPPSDASGSQFITVRYNATADAGGSPPPD